MFLILFFKKAGAFRFSLSKSLSEKFYNIPRLQTYWVAKNCAYETLV